MALQEPNRHLHGQHKKYKAFFPPQIYGKQSESSLFV